MNQQRRAPQVPPVEVSKHQRGEGIPFERRNSSTARKGPTTRRDQVDKRPQLNYLLTWCGNKPSKSRRTEGAPSKRYASQTKHNESTTRFGVASYQWRPDLFITRRDKNSSRNSRNQTPGGFDQEHTVGQVIRQIGTGDSICCVVW